METCFKSGIKSFSENALTNKTTTKTEGHATKKIWFKLFYFKNFWALTECLCIAWRLRQDSYVWGVYWRLYYVNKQIEKEHLYNKS